MKTQLNFIIKHPEGCEAASNIYDSHMKARIIINTMKAAGWKEDDIKVEITSRINPHWKCDFFIKKGETRYKEYDPNPIITKRDQATGLLAYL